MSNNIDKKVKKVKKVKKAAVTSHVLFYTSLVLYLPLAAADLLALTTLSLSAWLIDLTFAAGRQTFLVPPPLIFAMLSSN